MADVFVDVFICGAGPVGLLLAYALTRGGVSVHIVDSQDKASPAFPMYGRASTLHPRSQEILDQHDLLDDLAQIGFTTDSVWSYKEGKPLGSGWNVFKAENSEIETTFFKDDLNIRLKYSEDVLRARLGPVGVTVKSPVAMETFELDGHSEYPVSTTCIRKDGSKYLIRSKYIVGCDGGHSKVRQIAGISFTGSDTVSHWVRLDGIVETNIPNARDGIGMMQSATHGNTLYVPLDHGATRVGYVLSQSLFDKYGFEMSAENAAKEAREAMKPFELDFIQVDWHTVYGIRQHVAERLQDRGRVLLAGDAGHTHSSGLAQGMNTGIHDAAGLSWRLAGTIRGWLKPGVLETYAHERLLIAKRLIQEDETTSALISGKKPPHLTQRLETTEKLLEEQMTTTSSFVTGLGVSYPINLLNHETDTTYATVRPGHRAPDTLVQRPGFDAACMTRLLDVMKEPTNLKFALLVFAGDPRRTSASLKALRSQVDDSFKPYQYAVQQGTIISGRGFAVDEFLTVPSFGKGYWDPEKRAHSLYGIDDSQGAMVAVRPDGIVGLTASLTGVEDVINYFASIIEPGPSSSSPGSLNDSATNVKKYSELESTNFTGPTVLKNATSYDLPSTFGLGLAHGVLQLYLTGHTGSTS